jgi:hypothetical protein
MAFETTDSRSLRRELAETGQDPFTIAALAMEQNQRLQRRIKHLEERLNQRPTAH